MISKLLQKLTKKVRISYGITVCNEAEELHDLLEFLMKYKEETDEIIVLADVTNPQNEVGEVLKKFNDKIKIIESKLNGDFATFKNNFLSVAGGNYLFQIDADEVPTEILMKSLKPFIVKKYRKNCFFVPRLNRVDGLTEEHLKNWNWQINGDGFVNFPDYQPRIIKIKSGIRWKNKVHETFDGKNLKIGHLPSEDYTFCLEHNKTIERQARQNAFYDKL